MAFIDDLEAEHRGSTLTAALSELVPAHWWEQPLDTQTALRLKAALLFRPGTVLISVPYHLKYVEPDSLRRDVQISAELRDQLIADLGSGRQAWPAASVCCQPVQLPTLSIPSVTKR
jgi:hypothetical protein